MSEFTRTAWLTDEQDNPDARASYERSLRESLETEIAEAGLISGEVAGGWIADTVTVLDDDGDPTNDELTVVRLTLTVQAVEDHDGA